MKLDTNTCTECK